MLEQVVPIKNFIIPELNDSKSMSVQRLLGYMIRRGITYAKHANGNIYSLSQIEAYVEKQNTEFNYYVIKIDGQLYMFITKGCYRYNSCIKMFDDVLGSWGTYGLAKHWLEYFKGNISEEEHLNFIFKT